MALKPMIYKADLGEDNPKGVLPAEALRTLLSFLGEKKVGILNITGEDVSQIGTINVVGSTAQVTFRAGYVLIYGGLSYVEEGTTMAFNLPSSGTVNGVIGIKVNLAENGANEVTWFQKSTGLQQDDLNANKVGVYEFPIYNYTATANTFVLGEKTTEVIDGLGNDLDKYFRTGTATYTSGGLTLKLKKLPRSNIVFAEISGNVKSKGLGIFSGDDSITLPAGLTTSYSFTVAPEFAPAENLKVFQTGNLEDLLPITGDQYPQILTYGVNGSNNIFMAYVSSAEEFTTNGVLKFSVTGIRKSSNFSVVNHPIRHTFIYEGI